MNPDQPDLFAIFKAPPTPPKTIRTLWRLQGPSRVMVGRIERHPYGRELVIAFEDGDDVIETRLERFGTTALEERPKKSVSCCSKRLGGDERLITRSDAGIINGDAGAARRDSEIASCADGGWIQAWRRLMKATSV